MRYSSTAITILLVATLVLGGGIDDDNDGVPNDLDCRPSDGTLWAPPATGVSDLMLSRVEATAVLGWTTPADTGGDPGTERYDTYGTLAFDRFGYSTGFCVELDDGGLTSSDDRALRPGEIAHYLVRIENDCGTGPIDTDTPAVQPRSLNYVVADNTNDAGPGSLRAAIDLAQDGDAICIDTTGTITLSSGALFANKTIALVGPGAPLLTIEAATSDSSVLSLDESGAVCSGLTIDGAGMANLGVGTRGGNLLDAVTVQGSATGVWRGGATGTGLVSIRDSLIRNNDTGIDRSFGAELTITSSTISNNDTGIRNYVGWQPLTVVSSTVHSNTVGVYTGYNYSTLTFDSSTISNNTIGVELAVSGSVILVSSTISGNETGIYSSYADTFARVENTILSNTTNCVQYGYDNDVRSNGYSVFSDDSCDHWEGPGDQIDVDPLLGPLANNGGPTLTQAPLPGSPVMDAGSCPDATFDQRGLPRPVDDPGVSNVDDGCDIGAVENQ